MALPDLLFTQTQGAQWLAPDDIGATNDLQQYEAGGIAISDGTQGITGWTWTSVYSAAAGTISLKNVTTNTTELILSGLFGLTWISFAFDQNMRPNIAWTEADGTCKFRWYDTVIENYTTTTLPAGSATPSLCHDDKREYMVKSGLSDVLLFYIINGVVYHRRQRDRYNTTYQIATVSPEARIKKAAMAKDLRVKISLTGGSSFISSP